MGKRITVRLSRELHEVIENYAKTRGTTISDAIRTIVVEYFEGYKHSLNDYVIAKVIANDELFYNLVKAKLLVDERARVILREILKELD